MQNKTTKYCEAEVNFIGKCCNIFIWDHYTEFEGLRERMLDKIGLALTVINMHLMPLIAPKQPKSDKTTTAHPVLISIQAVK